MRLGVGFDERYESIARVMHHSTDTLLASAFAMAMIVLKDDNRLLAAFAGMFDIASMKIAVAAVVSAHRADALLLGQQLRPKTLPLARVHRARSFSSPRSHLTSTFRA